MDYFRKIDKMRVARGWSFYRLSQESGLSQQTFTKWMNGKTTPTLLALQAFVTHLKLVWQNFLPKMKSLL